jgi:hypothetical protein
MKLYVAHQFKHRHEVLKIIMDLDKLLPNIIFYNPFYSEYRKEIDIADKLNANTKTYLKLNPFSIKQSKKIVKTDLTNIRKSDGILAIIFDKDTLGSYMEIFFASYILKIPVFVICYDEVIFSHIWIKALTYRFKCTSDFVNYMRTYYDRNM